MPRLLMVTTIPETLRAFLLPYADFFRSRGWSVDAMSADISSKKQLSSHFDNLIDMAWNRNPTNPANFTAAPKLRRAVVDGNYDIVHAHTPVASFVTRYALRKLRKKGLPKVVYTAHGFHFYSGGPTFRNTLFLTLEKMAGNWTDKLVTINAMDYYSAEKNEIVPEGDLVYMPGIGLDFAKYDRETVSADEISQLRKYLSLKSDDVLYSMVAEFNPGKSHKDVIQALAATKDPKIHVAFAGSGALMTDIQKMATKYEVRNRTHFMGFLEDTRPLLLASRAALIPSEREGLSRTAMESACLGIPIIGSDARGVREIVEEGRGLIYPHGDPLGLRDAMLQLRDEPFGQVVPDPAWRIDNLLSLHERLYNQLLSTEKE